MKITRRQLNRLIREAMYDPRTLPKDYIPASMIASDDEEEKEMLQKFSADSPESYNQAVELVEPPAVIDMAGGYQGALQKADRMRDRDLFDAMLNKDKQALIAYGFNYPAESIDSFSHQHFADKLSMQARAIGCRREDLASVYGYQYPGERGYGTYEKILNMIKKYDPQGKGIPGDSGTLYGKNRVHDVNGLKILHNNYGTYETFNICG